MADLLPSSVAEAGVVIGWCPAVASRLRGHFRSSFGQRLLRVVRGMFDRFRLEQPQGDVLDDGLWFFASCPTAQVSLLKWNVWAVVFMNMLSFPVPHAALHLLIASNFLTRYFKDDKEAVHDIHSVPSCCALIVAKLDKVMAAANCQDLLNVAEDYEEQLIARRCGEAAQLPASGHQLRECLSLFDVAALLAALVAAWIPRQTVQCLEQLVLHAQAMAGQGGQEVGKLLLFYLEYQAPLHPRALELTAEPLLRVQTLEWKGTDLRNGARQMLQDLEPGSHRIPDPDPAGSPRSSINTFWTAYSKLPQTLSLHNIESESERIGQLLYTWSRTAKGKRDQQELSVMCNAVAAGGFVEHVQSTLKGGSNEECQMPYRAAGAVFGDMLSSQFVTLCAHAMLFEDEQEEEATLDIHGIGEMIDMASLGWFQAAEPHLIPRHGESPEPVQYTSHNTMVLYLAYVVIEDRLDPEHKNERASWIEDCEHTSLCCLYPPPVFQDLCQYGGCLSIVSKENESDVFLPIDPACLSGAVGTSSCTLVENDLIR